ncbi:MAG TPA: hypothetical protein VMV69_02565, partial [Pirellulales bacterium]|nr:hypothetical protein [Pirellulales bacterium]
MHQASRLTIGDAARQAVTARNSARRSIASSRPPHATKVDRFHPDRRRGEDRRRRLVPTSITTPRRSIAFTPTDDRR